MCIFCDIIEGKIPSYKVYEDEKVIGILDISQVTKGHCIVMPKKHVANILEADDETANACMHAAKSLAQTVVTKTNANGVNILTNCKEAAGQTVDHLHFHVIPRFDETDAISITFNESDNKDLDAIHKLITE